MSNPSERHGAEGDLLTAGEAVRIIWEWRKYRNEAFWKTVYRYGAAVIAVSMAPYLLPDLIGKLGLAVLAFPAMGSFLSILAAWLMAVQYRLYCLVNNRFRSLLGTYDSEDIPGDTLVNRMLRTTIGKIVVTVFLCFGVIGEFCNGLILFWLVRGVLP
jgi:hypothetical protein